MGKASQMTWLFGRGSDAGKAVVQLRTPEKLDHLAKPQVRVVTTSSCDDDHPRQSRVLGHRG